MKKFTAIFLSLLMIFSMMGVMASAASENQCTHHANGNADGPCHCCVYCPNIDISYLTSCAKDESVDGRTFDGGLCCYECTGIVPCNCGCECCEEDNKGENITDGDNTIDKFWGPEQQENFVKGFQDILKKISDWFDMVFDTIFEFLRLGEIVPQ